MSPTRRRVLMAACLLAAAGFVRLGFWQLHRLDERRAANKGILAARAAPVVTLSGMSIASAESLVGRRVTAVGRYDHDHDIVLRGGAYQGVPGVYLATPLRLAGSDAVVLVERGFVPAPDAVTADAGAFAEPGEVRVTGLVRSLESGGGNPLTREGRTTWTRLDLDRLRDSLPYPILPVSIRQIPDPSLPSFPRRLDPPPVDDGPHLNYALQWFFFAIMAVAFAFLVIGRRPGS
ncbi:MAG TPA: SURF1 family protein [Gemmatimonadales bacterium]|jgi:surfeit locus 1 family protein